MNEGHSRALAPAIVIAGFVTYAQLYAPQTVLPILGAELGLTSAETSVIVSAATLGVALSVVPWSFVALRLGYTGILRTALLVSGVVGCLAPLLPGWELVLAARFIVGVGVGALPALAVSFIADTQPALRVPHLVGLLVMGNTLGGLAGRVISASLVDVVGWRWALSAVSIVCTLLAVVFAAVVPASVRPPQRHRRLMADIVVVSRAVGADLRGSRLPLIYAQMFLLLGAFIAMYTYLPHRLIDEPFDLPPAVASAVFCVYLTGIVSGAVAGRLIRRWGNVRVLAAASAVALVGIGMVLVPRLEVVVVGLALFSFAWFVASTSIGSWVPREATHARGQGVALMHLAGFLGTVIVTTVVGVVFDAGGWSMVVVAEAGVVLVALASLLALGRPRAGHGRRE